MLRRIGPPLLGLLPFITMFLVTSISMLRERTSGTLERLMSMPVAKLDLLAGYGIAFGLVALVQTVILALVSFGLPDLDSDRTVLLVVLAILNALLGMALGLFVGAFVTSGVPGGPVHAGRGAAPAAAVRPLRRPRRDAGWLEVISYMLPLTDAYDALSLAMSPGELGGEFARDVVIVVAVTVGALALGALTLRRRTA